MRGLLIAVAAALCGAAVAWGATRVEFRQPESPVGVTTSPPSSDSPQPQVAVEGESVFDFGVMEVSQTASHTFRLRNVGTAPLILTKGETTCKCTMSELAEGALPPGETREVTLEWTPNGPTDLFEQTAEILTTDPARRAVRLQVRGRVRSSLRVEPPGISMGHFSSKEVSTWEVSVWSFREPIWQMVGFEALEPSTAEFFTVEARDMTPRELSSQADAKNGQVLRIIVKPGIPVGRLSQTLRISHNQEGRDPIDITLSGNAVGDITLSGPAYNSERDMVDIGNVRSRQAFTARLFVVVKGPHRSDTQLKIKSIDPESSLRVTLGEPKNRQAKSVLWPLTVEIPADAQPTNRLGSELGRLARIELETTHPEIPQYTVRLRFAVTGD
jgi:hypothetical protein